jgi:hypothetical protein
MKLPPFALLGVFLPLALITVPALAQLEQLNRVRAEGLKLNSPMGLYAKIIDQYGKPVVGISVDVKYRYYSNIVRTSWESQEGVSHTISDALGEFGFSGVSGVYLRFEPVIPEGIKLSPPACGEMFERGNDGKPRPIIYTKENPFVFRAWRMGKPGILKEGDIHELQEPTWDVYSLNLSSNKLTKKSGGDIEIQIKREMNMPPGYIGPWSFKMHGVNYRFRQVTNEEDPFRFMAPVDGYDSEFSVSFSDPKNADYRSDPTYRFWIFDGKHYGVMGIRVSPFYGEGSMVSVSYRQSLKEGDRNLQPAR